MVVLKLVTVVVAGILSLLAVRHMMRARDAAKVRVKTGQNRHPQAATRLRQDPRTGVYYPER